MILIADSVSSRGFEARLFEDFFKSVRAVDVVGGGPWWGPWWVVVARGGALVGGGWWGWWPVVEVCGGTLVGGGSVVTHILREF